MCCSRATALARLTRRRVIEAHPLEGHVSDSCKLTWGACTTAEAEA
jgi:hypothetical protein